MLQSWMMVSAVGNCCFAGLAISSCVQDGKRGLVIGHCKAGWLKLSLTAHPCHTEGPQALLHALQPATHFALLRCRLLRWH